ncbi:MAG: 3-phosphoshikimate 1-carboxyvinyltransferase [Bacteroidales bacterium]|jgi:3-phosphoshikimate 1-carboxyvinyltransferase|nr:3-phosphoshikimate 1-carboxyvinyltransferase [Bacteroidales bacterium]
MANAKILIPTHTLLKGRIQLSTSKSESNRALMIRAYGGFDRLITQLSDAEDTQLLKANLKQIKECSQSAIPLVIDCGNAGTVFRFLLTYLATLPGKWMLTGSGRMQERPVGELVESLRSLGADISYTGKEGFAPLRIHGKMLNGGQTAVDISRSSQFASSLLLAAPQWENGLTLQLGGSQSSLPYIEMTIALMRHFGADVKQQNDKIIVEPVPYKNVGLRIHPDWSAASYWYEMMALSKGGELVLDHLSLESLQGDKVIAQLFEQLGVQTHQEPDGVRIFQQGEVVSAFECDLRHHPDLLPALAVSCAGLGITAKFTGLDNLVHKESNRLLALKTELLKLEVFFQEIEKGSYILKPNNKLPVFDASKPLLINCWADHRIAMAFAPLALKVGALQLDDPDVVAKSYPAFWSMMRKTGLFNQG